MPPTRECPNCGSDQIQEFDGDIAIHFPGLDGLNKPIVWVSPKVLACLNCGGAEFQVPQDQLRVLDEHNTP
jgi:hypothetical protein